MLNDNALENITCPNCGQNTSFSITATADFDVTDEGTGDYSNVEWDGSSLIRCQRCNQSGEVNQFNENNLAIHRLYPYPIEPALTRLDDHAKPFHRYPSIRITFHTTTALMTIHGAHSTPATHADKLILTHSSNLTRGQVHAFLNNPALEAHVKQLQAATNDTERRATEDQLMNFIRNYFLELR